MEDVHCSLIHNSQEMETTYVSVVDEQTRKLNIQFILEQPGFELCRSTYMWIFFQTDADEKCSIPRMRNSQQLTFHRNGICRADCGTRASRFWYMQGPKPFPCRYQETIVYSGILFIFRRRYPAIGDNIDYAK